MMIHELKFKLKKKKRLGRGKRGGNYSGRGQKGQKSRAGRNIKDQNLEKILKLPKKRGWKFKSKKEKPKVINLDVLNKYFNDGEVVNEKSLIEKGLIKEGENYKILGRGKLTKKLKFEGVKISQRALEKIKNINI
jgi:large subunit ribosomal protein L15